MFTQMAYPANENKPENHHVVRIIAVHLLLESDNRIHRLLATAIPKEYLCCQILFHSFVRFFIGWQEKQ